MFHSLFWYIFLFTVNIPSVMIPVLAWKISPYLCTAAVILVPYSQSPELDSYKCCLTFRSHIRNHKFGIAVSIAISIETEQVGLCVCFFFSCAAIWILFIVFLATNERESWQTLLPSSICHHLNNSFKRIIETYSKVLGRPRTALWRQITSYMLSTVYSVFY